MAGADNDTLVDYRSPESAQVTHVRSTLLASSVQTLQANGFLERYLEELPKAHHAELLAPQAPSWLGIELAELHYTACERMRLSPRELTLMSDSVVKSIANTMLATFLRSSRAIGGTPWHSLAQAERLYTRLMRGGSIRVTRRGPKEALIESRGCRLYKLPYYAAGYSMVFRAAALLFGNTAYARLLPASELEHKVVLAWV